MANAECQSGIYLFFRPPLKRFTSQPGGTKLLDGSLAAVEAEVRQGWMCGVINGRGFTMRLLSHGTLSEAEGRANVHAAEQLRATVAQKQSRVGRLSSATLHPHTETPYSLHFLRGRGLSRGGLQPRSVPARSRLRRSSGTLGDLLRDTRGEGGASAKEVSVVGVCA